MATSPQQIGWSQESKLLWQLKQIVAKYGKTSAYKAYPSLASFPLPGSPNTLYLALDTSKIYYWDETTSSYIEVSAGITSVGLTMPAAFAVANSPLTANGTINVTGAGLISQYVRGDGSLSDFPGSTGGGASVNYYFNGGTSQGVFGGDTYYEMSKVADTGAAANFSISADGYVAQFLTDAGDPNLLQIPGGAWDIELYMNADSAGGTPNFYVELYKYDGSTFTLLGSSSGNPEFITNGTSVDLYYTSVAVPTTTLLLTDRLAMRVYVNHSGKTITLHTQDNTLALVQTTFTSGLTAINGLTAQVQYLGTGTTGTDFNISSVGATHTFNIPTASALNRGLLSSADWTTFNNKPSVNLYTGNGTLTGDRTLTSGGFNLTFTGSNTASGGTARGLLFNQTLIASANNNVLSALDITPTFTLGAFTGVSTFFARMTTSINSTATFRLSNATAGNNAGTNLEILADGQNATTVGKNSSTKSTYKNIKANDTFLYGSSGSPFDIVLQTDGPGSSSSRILFAPGGSSTALMTLTAAGRLLLGTTTESTFLLDVNGTARVSGVLTLSATNSLSNPASSYINWGNNTFIGTSTIIYGLTGNTLGFRVSTNESFIFGTGQTSSIRLDVDKGIAISDLLTSGQVVSRNASAIIQSDSTTKGFLPPRMTSAQRVAIASPAEGLVVVQTDGTSGLYLYIGGVWRALAMV
jgi:hypothetical protein